MPGVAPLTVSLFLHSSGGNTRPRRGLLKGNGLVKKALRGVETEMRELLGGTEEKSLSVMRGHYKLMIFSPKGNRI